MQLLQQTQMPILNFLNNKTLNLPQTKSIRLNFQWKPNWIPCPKQPKSPPDLKTKRHPDGKTGRKWSPKEKDLSLKDLEVDLTQVNQAMLICYPMLCPAVSVCLSLSLCVFGSNNECIAVKSLYIYKILKEMTSRGRKGHNNYNYNYKLGLTDTLSLCVG